MTTSIGNFFKKSDQYSVIQKNQDTSFIGAVVRFCRTSQAPYLFNKTAAALADLTVQYFPNLGKTAEMKAFSQCNKIAWQYSSFVRFPETYQKVWKSWTSCAPRSGTQSFVSGFVRQGVGFFTKSGKLERFANVAEAAVMTFHTLNLVFGVFKRDFVSSSNSKFVVVITGLELAKGLAKSKMAVSELNKTNKSFQDFGRIELSDTKKAAVDSSKLKDVRSAQFSLCKEVAAVAGNICDLAAQRFMFLKPVAQGLNVASLGIAFMGGIYKETQGYEVVKSSSME